MVGEWVLAEVVLAGGLWQCGWVGRHQSCTRLGRALTCTMSQTCPLTFFPLFSPCCSMSRLCQSLRRRLHRTDSPPVPRSRSLSGGGGHGRSASGGAAAAHLPAIPEAAPGCEPAMATVWPPEAAAAETAAAASAAALAAQEQEVGAVPVPPASPAPTTLSSSGGAGGGSFEEVDLSEPKGPAAAPAPPRRFGSFSCACFAEPRPLR